MKKVLITTVGLLMLYIGTIAQNAKRASDGNFIAIKSEKVKDTTLVSTGNTYTDSKGEVYTVYKTKNEKLFIIRMSKSTGKKYKQYLKIED